MSLDTYSIFYSSFCRILPSPLRLVFFLQMHGSSGLQFAGGTMSGRKFKLSRNKLYGQVQAPWRCWHVSPHKRWRSQSMGQPHGLSSSISPRALGHPMQGPVRRPRRCFGSIFFCELLHPFSGTLGQPAMARGHWRVRAVLSHFSVSVTQKGHSSTAARHSYKARFSVFCGYARS